jgi:hypothetical protein
MDKNGKLKTMAPATVESLLSKEVASCGEITLDNRSLNLYYQQTMYDFTREYADYLDYMMDQTIGLDEQLSMDGERTWHELMVAAAIENFHQVAALYQEAVKNGFEMTANSKDFLDSLKTSLDSSAATAGFADADAYLESTFGPGITFDVYYEFSMINALATDYLNNMVMKKVYTDEELNAYYEENKDMFEQSHIKKVDKNVVNVRHILLEVEKDAEQSVWDETLAEAEAILQEWKDGKATEISFSVLAGEHSDDPGSAENGGLYESVYPGQMVQPFEDWCFADGRQVGDTGIVKTEYGYHIMYFVRELDYVFWETLASANMRSTLATEIRSNITKDYKTRSNRNILILEYFAPTNPTGDGAMLNPVE